MGFGVGDGRETAFFQDAMIKRKRVDGGSVRGSKAGSESAAKSMEKLDSEFFLRHDGHFHSKSGRKKGQVCTFVKQYRLKWRKNKAEVQQPMNQNQSLEYPAAAVGLTDAKANIRALPTCGVDCYQVREEIFQKVKGLMAHEPEKLHMKARIRPNEPDKLGTLPALRLEQPMYTVDTVCTVESTSTSGEQDRESRTQIAATATTRGHQGVQTVFTENKKVQTISYEPKQVQWAIHAMDSLSPKVAKLSNEAQKPADQMQDKDSWLQKIQSKLPDEIHAQDTLPLYGEAANAAKETKQSPTGDSPELVGAKKSRDRHHKLLYQEAVEIAKEQRDSDRAREQKQDFWLVYERELKRGKGLHVEEVETERKDKQTAKEEPELETEKPVEEVSARVKIKHDAFLDENLTVTTTSPVSSSPRDERISSEDGEAAAIVQQLLDKLGSRNVEVTKSNPDAPIGLQGLRKVEEGDYFQSLEAMEQQLNPESSEPAVHLSPTELDCMKVAILSHNFYPRLVTSFINQHKAVAPPEQAERLEKIRNQVMENWRQPGIPLEKPAHEEKIKEHELDRLVFALNAVHGAQKKYQDILTKFERQLEKPFQDSMDFSWQMENYLDTIPPSRGRSEGGGSSTNLKDFNDENDT